MTKAKPTSRRLITFPERRLLKRISLGRIQIGQLMDQGEAAEGNSFPSFPEYAEHARRDVVQWITEAWPLEIIPADAEAVRKTAEHIADRVRPDLIMILGGRDGTLNLYRNQYTRVRIDLEKVERDLLERRHPKRPEWTP
jgi:hypothetical protein